jgi:IMP dehydrogenase
MNVSDAMTPRSELVTVELPGTRSDALEYLQEKQFSSVPVVKETEDGEQFRGLLSRERLIERPDEDQLAMLMEEVPTIDSGATLYDLAELITERGSRRVPVVDDAGQLEGIVTVTDVIEALASGDVPGDIEVETLASRTINSIYAGAPVAVAERQIAYADLPYAVVLDDTGEMNGMFTEVDLLEVAEIVDGKEMTGDSFADQDSDWMWEGIKGVGSRALPTRNVEFPAGPVSDIMTEDVETVSGHKTATKAAQLLLTHDIEQLPMVTGDELDGIVRDVDLLGALIRDPGGETT